MVFPRLDELTNNVKTLQPKPDSVNQAVYDLLIKTAVDKIINDVVAFTNVPAEELPKEVDTPMLLKLSGWFTDAGVFMSAEDRHQGAVTGITEGDTQITYGSPQNALSTLGSVSFIDSDFKVILMRYRRIRGWSYE